MTLWVMEKLTESLTRRNIHLYPIVSIPYPIGPRTVARPSSSFRKSVKIIISGLIGHYREKSGKFGEFPGAEIPKKKPAVELGHTKTKSMKRTTTLPKNHISKLVERGYALQNQIVLLNAEFAGIKDQLKAEALTRPAEHVALCDKSSEGGQWIATGRDCECRIVFPSPKIKAGIDPLEPDFKTIKALTGDHFSSLFDRVVAYEPVDKRTFRDDVSRFLAESAASQVLELCTSPSEPKAVWKARPAK